MACPRCFELSTSRRRLEVRKGGLPRCFELSTSRRRLEVRKGGLPPLLRIEHISKKIRGKEGWLAPALQSKLIPLSSFPRLRVQMSVIRRPESSRVLT